MNPLHPHSYKATFAYSTPKARRFARLLAPLVFGTAALFPMAPGASAQPAAGRDDWRIVADLTEPAAIPNNFVERGASQFATSSKQGLLWTPTATNLYSLIYAQRTRPIPVADRAIAVEFLLPTNNSSFGLHLHAETEESASHLILVTRGDEGKGLIRVYRTPLWPSTSIDASDMLPPLARLINFPANDWHRLMVTTRINMNTGHTTLAVRLTTEDVVIGSVEVVDSGPALPTAGLIGLRLFGPGNGEIRVRRILGQR